jgi:hypothetical protein
MSPPLSRPPAGVPQTGGNAKYAIVAIVLLLGAGGIYWWRSMTNRDQAPAPPPPSAIASASADPAPTNPKLDDIPPPPPPEEKPEAGAGGGKVVYVQGGGCEGKCGGSATSELTSALQMRGAQARRCYNQALAQDSSLKGHVTIAVRIGPQGNVCSANVASTDMGGSSVGACAANIFRNAQYPAPRGGCLDANVPLNFVPQGQ